MGIIKAKQLVHEYIRRDEEGNVESIQTALDHIDLDVQPGQFIAILGHNGSGKSTLAKHINALLAPTEGSLWVDGKDVTQEENILPVRKTAGMVFQNPDNQIIASVVEEDVGFGPENIGVPTDEIWQRVEESLKSVGMFASFIIARAFRILSSTSFCVEDVPSISRCFITSEIEHCVFLHTSNNSCPFLKSVICPSLLYLNQQYFLHIRVLSNLFQNLIRNPLI